MKRQHSQEFKKAMVQKVTTPGDPTIMQLSEKTGIHHTSIRNWIKNYANNSIMEKSKEWSPEERLQVIAKTLTINENELGEFLRAKGLHMAELEEWKQVFL